MRIFRLSFARERGGFRAARGMIFFIFRAIISREENEKTKSENDEKMKMNESEHNTEIAENAERTESAARDFPCASDGGTQSGIYCLPIIGQVEGHYLFTDNQKATKYELVLPRLVELEEDPRTEGVLILLNTMGGDVEAGLAIAEMIASMTKPCVSLVLGGGHSIGVPLAVAAAHSFIVPSATMTIHPVRISGTVVGAPQTYSYFHDMQERIIAFICAHSHADADVLRELMMRPDQIATDVGSVLEGAEAVRYGIIDELGGLGQALAHLKGCISEKKSTNKAK